MVSASHSSTHPVPKAKQTQTHRLRAQTLRESPRCQRVCLWIGKERERRFAVTGVCQPEVPSTGQAAYRVLQSAISGPRGPGATHTDAAGRRCGLMPANRNPGCLGLPSGFLRLGIFGNCLSPRGGRPSVAQGAAGTPQVATRALGRRATTYVGRAHGQPVRRRAAETENAPDVPWDVGERKKFQRWRSPRGIQGVWVSQCVHVT